MKKKDKQIIKDAEINEIPIFVLTAKDRNTLKCLEKYIMTCLKTSPSTHTNSVIDRYDEFLNWQIEHPDKVKYPD
jgi:hypothetical protein